MNDPKTIIVVISAVTANELSIIFAIFIIGTRTKPSNALNV